MQKQEIIKRIQQNYQLFIDYIQQLNDKEFMFSYQQKWTAGQQLHHIVICVKPLTQVFGMDKTMIAQNFGTSDRENVDYETLRTKYVQKLEEGGKAPERFLPEDVSLEQKNILCEQLSQLIIDLCNKIDNFDEKSLETLNIPHPLLGALTLKEMLYNCIYHVEHHHHQIKSFLLSMENVKV